MASFYKIFIHRYLWLPGGIRQKKIKKNLKKIMITTRQPPGKILTGQAKPVCG